MPADIRQQITEVECNYPCQAAQSLKPSFLEASLDFMRAASIVSNACCPGRRVSAQSNCAPAQTTVRRRGGISRPATCAAQEWRPRLSTVGLLTGSEGSLSALALMRAVSAMRAASLLSLLPKRCTDEEERQALKQKFLERICFVDLALIENRLLGELQITKSGWEAGCFSWTFP